MRIKQSGLNTLNFSLVSPLERRKRVGITIFSGEDEAEALKNKNDVLIWTKADPLSVSLAGKNTFVIGSPGEYEIQGVFIQGLKINSQSKTVAYALIGDDLNACYLEGEKWQELKPEELEKLGEIHILLITVDKAKGLSGSEIRQAISQIEPKLVVLSFSFPAKEGSKTVEDFLAEMRLKKIEYHQELNLKREDLKEEGRKIIALTNS